MPLKIILSFSILKALDLLEMLKKEEDMLSAVKERQLKVLLIQSINEMFVYYLLFLLRFAFLRPVGFHCPFLTDYSEAHPLEEIIILNFLIFVI